MDKTPSKKVVLPLYMLVCLVVSSVIGGGIYALPQNMALVSGGAGMLISWLITGVGMTFLAVTFLKLSVRRPDVDTGMYGYVQMAFGDYPAFFTLWGLWNLYWIANAGLIVLIFSALGELPGMEMFKDGLTTEAIIGEVIVAFLLAALFEAGFKTAAIFNAVMTVIKILPLLLFAIFAALAFQADTFSFEFYGSVELGSTLDQVTNCMLYTAWLYTGFDAAITFGSRGESPRESGKATVIGFILITAIYIATCVLAFGVVPRDELARMSNPSMAGIMRAAAGPWASNFINIAMIISVFGCLFACTMTMSEYLYNMGRGDRPTGPRVFSKLSSRAVPSASLWLATVLTAAILIYSGVTGAGYNELILLCTSLALIPYFLSSLAAVKDSMADGKILPGWFCIATVAAIYSLWLIYAGGLKYLLLSAIPYSVGIFFFAYSRKERGLKVFMNKKEALVACLIIAAAVFAGCQMAAGRLTL